MNNDTDRLIRSLLIAVEQRTRAECILSISTAAPNAAKVKKMQRAERHALAALNKHLKQCIKLVSNHSKKGRR